MPGEVVGDVAAQQRTRDCGNAEGKPGQALVITPLVRREQIRAGGKAAGGYEAAAKALQGARRHQLVHGLAEARGN